MSLDDRSRTSALPWRGQFSPLTAHRLLAALAPEHGLVLDPFVGSGTTLLEAARLGLPSIGLDINPAAVAFAVCAALASSSAEERETVVGQAGLAASQLAGRSGDAEIGVAHALALLSHTEKSPDAAVDRLRGLIAALPREPVPTRARLGDARATGLEDTSVDFVLTSPPYINVFNYHQFGRPVSDAFGWPVLVAARSEIGSNRQNRGNRFRTVVQYAADMALVLQELARVLRPGSTAVFVLGRESRVRGTPFYNGEILARLAERLGLFGDFGKAERRFTSRFGQIIYEDVLVLRDSRPDGAIDAVAIGCEVGRQALRECRPGDDVRADVQAVLDMGAAIAPSPIVAATA